MYPLKEISRDKPEIREWTLKKEMSTRSSVTDCANKQPCEQGNTRHL